MDREQIRESLREILAVVDERLAHGVDLTEETPIREGLSLDSLQMTELVFEIEDRLQTKISDDEAMSLTTVGDLLDLIEAKSAGA